MKHNSSARIVLLDFNYRPFTGDLIDFSLNFLSAYYNIESLCLYLISRGNFTIVHNTTVVGLFRNHDRQIDKLEWRVSSLQPSFGVIVLDVA